MSLKMTTVLRLAIVAQEMIIEGYLRRAMSGYTDSLPEGYRYISDDDGRALVAAIETRAELDALLRRLEGHE